MIETHEREKEELQRLSIREKDELTLDYEKKLRKMQEDYED